MTNAQKWIAAFLGVFILLFAITKLTQKDESENSGAPAQTTMENSNSETEQNEGLALINRAGCINCHGADLKGTQMAPSLVNAKEYWKRESLINYLRNPSSYSSDARFIEYKNKYNSIMPPYQNIDVKDLGKMADYILKLN
ncbi:MAG: cytochrome c [bacterium]